MTGTNIVDDIYSLEKVTYSDEFSKKQIFEQALCVLKRYHQLELQFISRVEKYNYNRLMKQISKFKPNKNLPYKLSIALDINSVCTSNQRFSCIFPLMGKSGNY